MYNYITGIRPTVVYSNLNHRDKNHNVELISQLSNVGKRQQCGANTLNNTEHKVTMKASPIRTYQFSTSLTFHFI